MLATSLTTPRERKGSIDLAATLLKESTQSVTPFSTHATAGWGWRMFGIGLMGMGLAALVWDDFITGQTVPGDFPHRTALAYAVAAFLLLAGAILQWRKTAAITPAAIGCYYVVIVLFVMNGPVLLAHFKEYGTYENLAEQIAIITAAVILSAS